MGLLLNGSGDLVTDDVENTDVLIAFPLQYLLYNIFQQCLKYF